MGQPGPHGFPPHMAYLRVSSWVPSSTSFTLPTLLLFLPLTQRYPMQLYADDVQAYLHCSASDAIATTQVLTFIMGALEAWMSSNRLRLNSAKTQFIWLGTRQQLA